MFIDYIRIWAPMAISMIALIVTATFSWTNHIDRRTASRLAREKDLHVWVKEVGKIYIGLRSSDKAVRQEAVNQFPVYIDYGRLWFPNEVSTRALGEFSKGRRSSVLDPLVETYKRCEMMNDWELAKQEKDWREFTDQLRRHTNAYKLDTSPEAEGRTQYRNP